MSDELNGTPPISFYIVAGVFLFFNVTGLIFYYQQMTLTPQMLQGLDASTIAFMEATPVWATSGYAIAVNAGVVASIVLLLRKAWALPVYIVSFAGVLTQDFDAFVLRDAVGVWGSSAYYVPSVVLVMCLVEIWYSRSVANRYYR
ncbi:MAG: hypothetical protein IH838_03485 [Proteobacteria bacterium]|nr:hypothetical protein [Pseudomonadota bacterium]MCH9004333.1 hypothetical protein [Pseudomonadota bacterium]